MSTNNSAYPILHHGSILLALHPGVNILQKSGKLFPDENAKKGLTLPHLLSKFQESWELFPDIYRGIL